MEVAPVLVKYAILRETVRDARGVIVGVIERQRHAQRLIARDAHGVIVGVYDERSRTTRDAHGRLVGRANLLPALLWRGR